MSYPGRDSPKDIASRLRHAEPEIEKNADDLTALQREVAELPKPDEFDPGDLVVLFLNRLV